MNWPYFGNQRMLEKPLKIHVLLWYWVGFLIMMNTAMKWYSQKQRRFKAIFDKFRFIDYHYLNKYSCTIDSCLFMFVSIYFLLYSQIYDSNNINKHD